MYIIKTRNRKTGRADIKVHSGDYSSAVTRTNRLKNANTVSLHANTGRCLLRSPGSVI